MAGETVITAIGNLTSAPEGVKRSSGSDVRLPMTVMTVSPAMVSGPRAA